MNRRGIYAYMDSWWFALLPRRAQEKVMARQWRKRLGKMRTRRPS